MDGYLAKPVSAAGLARVLAPLETAPASPQNNGTPVPSPAY